MIDRDDTWCFFLVTSKLPFERKVYLQKNLTNGIKTDILEMSSPFLSSTNTNQFDKLLGLKEAFESQKKWYYVLL